jgi:hypothetical protein
VSFTGQSGKSYTFDLPSQWAHRPDNYQAAGQLLPAPIPATGIDSNGNPLPAQTITFLGAAATASSGGASVSATITYTDGNTQSISIGFADWSKSTPYTGGTVLASMPYRAIASSGAHQATPVYLDASPQVTLLDNKPTVAAGRPDRQHHAGHQRFGAHLQYRRGGRRLTIDPLRWAGCGPPSADPFRQSAPVLRCASRATMTAHSSAPRVAPDR